MIGTGDKLLTAVKDDTTGIVTNKICQAETASIECSCASYTMEGGLSNRFVGVTKLGNEIIFDEGFVESENGKEM